MTVDYRAAQQASRRVGGMPFRLQPMKRPRAEGNHRRLTWDAVRAARAWACGEGWGQPRTVQARVLAARLGVAEGTVADLLRNLAWYDPAYVPDRPDKAVWGGVAPTIAMLRLMAVPR